MRKEERNMDKLLISFLLSLFMVYFPPSDVVLPSQLEASSDSYVPMSSYPQETQSAKTPSPGSVHPAELINAYSPLSHSIRQLSVKPLDEPLINRLEKAFAAPVKYQSNYLRI
ncbi:MULTISPECIES: hypothetical protein [Bacillus]|uniref:hypothetical protein n=1 Tax=Bacillus TaxID=1386 RepID=UPI000BA8C3C6|nr:MULTISPECIES: hypothetical protein [Bacillus]AUZ37916.1 hypothetical protein C1T29_06220 [Bacillus sp. MBGLi79]PAO67327.1 hypothetical protein CIK44_18640 [Bacillus sp. X2(2017)]POO84511.1 hypothetical protein C1T30_04375 [Bacillus sp. MBGLi97]WGE38137.1 hypothetical protein QA442_17130 [Bacillus stercoris]